MTKNMDNLIAELRRNGITVVDRRGKAMGGSMKRNPSQITRIARHYTGVEVDQTIETLEGFWRNTRRWGTGGYSIYIRPSGVVYVNYDYDTISNGVGGENTRTLNICLTGGDSTFTAEQEKAFYYVCKKAQSDLGIPTEHVWGHKEFPNARTSCPGIDMNIVRKALNEGHPVGVDGGSKPNKPSSSKPSKKSDATIVQEVIAGKWGTGGDRKNKLNDAGYDADKIQDMVNAELQPKKPSIPQIKVDGSFGKNTTKRLQQVLGTTDDGVISGQYRTSITERIHSVKFGRGGSSVVRAMQKKLGVKVDGYLGANTLRALQRRMGTPVTGAISKSNSSVVKALQKRLNENRF